MREHNRDLRKGRCLSNMKSLAFVRELETWKGLKGELITANCAHQMN